MQVNSHFTKILIVLFSVGILIFLSFQKSEVHHGYALINHESQDFHVYHIDFKTDSVVLGWKDEEGKFLSTLSNFNAMLNGEAKMLTNAGMFHPSRLPVGLYIENGIQLFALDTSTAMGNFYLKPNGIFGVGNNGFCVLTTEQYQQQKILFSYATQSGPMLVIDGKIHSAFMPNSANRQVRSGIGVDANGRAVFAISKVPVNFYDFATLFRTKFGCSNALYLDGSISAMQCKDAGLTGDGKFGCMLAVLNRKYVLTN